MSDPELAALARLADEEVLGICLSVSRVLGLQVAPGLFSFMLGTKLKALMLSQQAFAH